MNPGMVWVRLGNNSTHKKARRKGRASGTQCPAIDGIIKEADETAGEIEDKAVLDAAIIANAQAVEHYEMCRYGTLIAWAERGEGCKHEAQHRGTAQGRQREGIDRGLSQSSDQPPRLRDIAEPPVFPEIPALRTDRILRRTYQAATETPSQASEAPTNAAATLFSTSNQNRIAKDSIPSAPTAAPAASSAAASRPRRTPSRPASRLRRVSCFSISVALAEDGGKSEKETADGCSITTADDPGEDRRPSAEREAIRYSCQRASLREDGEKRIGVMPVLRQTSAIRRRRLARTMSDTKVADVARSRARTRRWQTTTL